MYTCRGLPWCKPFFIEDSFKLATESLIAQISTLSMPLIIGVDKLIQEEEARLQ